MIKKIIVIIITTFTLVSSLYASSDGELLLKKNQHQKGLKFIHKGSGVIEFTQLNFKIF